MVVVTRFDKFVKTHWMVYLKWTELIECKSLYVYDYGPQSDII